ncbi:MAG TPA: hypothetical protein VHI93_01350 [Candidatus Thermoplasmatota archaeon]|nr:hypothetical protein [Candidatus Thermoplasmatota archaeon]
MTPAWISFQRRCALRMPGFLKNAILGRREALESEGWHARDPEARRWLQDSLAALTALARELGQAVPA